MKKHGFTLAEILVTVSIIGLLTSLATLAIIKSIRVNRQMGVFLFTHQIAASDGRLFYEPLGRAVILEADPRDPVHELLFATEHLDLDAHEECRNVATFDKRKAHRILLGG